MKRKLVEKMKVDGIPLPAALKAAELSSSSYYYKAKGVRKQRALDMDLVAAIHQVRQGRAEVYGYRKVTLALIS